MSDMESKCRDGYITDPWFQNKANTDSLVFEDGLYWTSSGQLVVPNDDSLRSLWINFAHDTPYAGHMGCTKTCELLKRYCWWPMLRQSVDKYVKACDVCLRVKASQHPPYGLLQPLPVPSQKWWVVSMDLITDLPPTRDGFDAIMVFVDKLSKMVHLAKTFKTCSAIDAARLFIDNVCRLHGPPRVVISDRDPRFTSKFFRAVSIMLGMEQHMSSAFHPQSDGQTERVNRVVEDYLRSFVLSDQSDWDHHLSMAEFAINNAYHESLKSTPFRVVYGIDPLTPLSFVPRAWVDKIKPLWDRCPSARSFGEDTQAALHRAKVCLDAARKRQKAYADKKRSDLTLNVGDNILLSTKNIKIRAHGSHKLLPRFIGPFPVVECVNPVAFKLGLPPSLKIHPVFHVSLLRPYSAQQHVGCPLPSILDDNVEFEVQDILKHEIRGKGKHKKTWFLVRWSGYGPESDTWEPRSNLTNCAQLIAEYWKRVDVVGAPPIP